jgi:hypothetical protein
MAELDWGAWLLELREQWHRRKLISFGLCFLFIIYPTSVMVLLICGDYCLDGPIDVQTRNLLIILISVFALVPCIISSLCMIVLFHSEAHIDSSYSEALPESIVFHESA